MKQRETRSDNGSSLASLLLRLAIGPTMFAHGYNKVFGGGGLEGTERWFDSIGFKPAAVHARMAAATEMGSGALVTLGALNPLPSAAVIGVMAVAAQSDHKGKGFFIFKGGWEYVAIMGAAAAALAGLGSGRWSVDHARGKDRKGSKYALVAIVLGLANSALLLKATLHPEEKTKDEPHGTP
jgi:putative oxidoreductase